MNYKRIYENIVKSQDLSSQEYTEVHHIIPKCMGGTNEPENLTRITARKHFLAHWLLCKIYPENVKLHQAFAMMSRSSRFHKRKLTSLEFEACRKSQSIASRERMRLNPLMKNPEIVKKISESKKGTKLSEEVKSKISKTKSGVKTVPHSEQTKLKQSGEEYHCPTTLKTLRVKVQFGEIPPEGWIKGRPESKYIWITDGVSNIRLHKDSPIPSGFKRGRSMLKNNKGEFTNVDTSS